MESKTESAPHETPCRYCGDAHPLTFSHCPKTGRPITSGQALVGKVLANRYRVLSLLGEGGMGAVYMAEHLFIGRKVAIKRLHPELTTDAKAVARFQREARAAASTGHEHIVEIIDLGFGEDGAPYLVMEYLRGRSLAKLLHAEGALEPRRACRIVGQVLAALAAVHRHGIVHRDLKPDNIILTRRRGDPDFVKVVDFGISKVQQEEGDALDLTRTGVTLGTPFYMSPEQARGIKALDHRVDLFGVGVILYELITGSLPFDGENYHQLLQAILSGEHAAPGALRPELDPELSTIIEKAIAQRPEHRYQSAREMLLALVPFGAVDPGPSPTEPPPRREVPTTHPRGSARLRDDDDDDIGESPTIELEAHGRATREAASEPRARSGEGAFEPATRKRASPPRLSPTAPPSPTPPIATASAPTPRPRGLVPTPVELGGLPRRFVAQSSNWRVVSAARPAGVARDRKQSYQAFRPSHDGLPAAPTPVTPSRATPADRDAPSDVKAALVLTALDQLRRLGPDAPRRVAARLGTDVGSRLASVLTPMAWVRLSDYVELLRAAEREIGTGDGTLASRFGRAAAENELGSTHRLFMQSATPTMAIERIPKLFRTYHSGGQVRVERSTAGGYRVVAKDLRPDTLVHALAMSGFYQRMLEMTGGRDVRAAVVSCRERGDDATVTVLRWR